MMGWASAPYDPLGADRHPRRAAWMALAGPVSNLLLLVLAAVGIRLGMAAGYFQPPESLVFTRIVTAGGEGTWPALAVFLSVLFTLNLLLFLFNLLPVPPLDGSSVITLLMPEDAARAYNEFMRQPMFGLLGILVAWKLIGEAFWPILVFVVGLLYPGVTYVSTG